MGKNRAIFTDSADTLSEIPYRKACCFSGHRPKGLPADKEQLQRLMEIVRDMAELLYYQGVDTFLTGMARGFDLLAADAIAFDPDIGKKVDIVCVMPYAGHRSEMLTVEEDTIYRRLQKRADTIVCLGDGFTKDCYRKRNKFMINNSSYLISYLKNEKKHRSGTAMTCKMARDSGHNIFMITEEDLRK